MLMLSWYSTGTIQGVLRLPEPFLDTSDKASPVEVQYFHSYIQDCVPLKAHGLFGIALLMPLHPQNMELF